MSTLSSTTMIEQNKAAESQYNELWRRFHEFNPKVRAEIRRVRTYEDLGNVPSFYHLFFGLKFPYSDQWHRIVYFFPYLDETSAVDGLYRPLGRQFLDHKISESRIVQLVRADHPQDMDYLRRLIQHAQPVANWRNFGSLLYYWGKSNARKILQDYCLAAVALDDQSREYQNQKSPSQQGESHD